MKFKNFVVTLRDERNQLKEKVNNDNIVIEKLKSSLKNQANTSQLFHNFQQLQNEYDKSQDEIEQLKKRLKHSDNDLLKCLNEMNELKLKNNEQKEEIQSLKHQQTQQESQIDLQKESIKEYESRIIVYETKLLEKDQQIQDFQGKVNEINDLQKELQIKNDMIEQLSQQLSDQTERLKQNSNQIDEQNRMIEKYSKLEMENANIVEKITENKHIIQNNEKEMEKFRQNESELRETIERLEKSLNDLRLSGSEKINNLELENYELKNKLELSEMDLRNNREKFDEYKSKVAIALKENKSLNHGDYNRQLELLNLKLENFEQENQKLRNESEKSTDLVEKLKSEISAMTAKLSESNNQLKDVEKYRQNLQQSTSENDRLNQLLKQLQISFARERLQISDTNREQMEKLRLEYENKIKDLEEELSNHQQRINQTNQSSSSPPSDDSNSIINSNTSFEEIKDENLSIRSNVSSSLERNFLEEILTESTTKSPSSTVNDNGQIVNGQNFENLTQLLAESENNINLLTEQNRLLKEEIRRLNRSFDRIDIANNLEYLKNVLLKFLTIKRSDEKEQLINVLSTILKLTGEETAIFYEFLSENFNSSNNQNQNNNSSNKSLTSSWNLWQWS
uniref:GRIP and coiled-coil domain-containing protein 2-like n=1 Tax=Dermatophagoides pteronyssinus TaxID=6956 RepID=A0A6P6YFL2_DERPT|nr:GRIP and coiled-coil domain-containing protein 2-like [Dermatophagoides pteronyssinus]